MLRTPDFFPILVIFVVAFVILVVFGVRPMQPWIFISSSSSSSSTTTTTAATTTKASKAFAAETTTVATTSGAGAVSVGRVSRSPVFASSSTPPSVLLITPRVALA